MISNRKRDLIRTSNYHVLGKALCQADAMTFTDEMSHSKSIFISIAAGKPLIRHIEKGVVLFFLDDVTNLLPLLF